MLPIRPAFQRLLEADERFPLLNQMRVSVAWIGILLIVSVLVYFTVYGYHVLEKFQNPPHDEEPVLEGFGSGYPLNEGFVANGSESGMNITMCPVASKSYLDTNGRTVCCMGDVASDKCKGETICSLSEGMASLPTCTKWFESYLREKGRKRCPRMLPMYFESADEKTRGCTNGRLNKDGSGPATLEQPKCMIYPEKKDDEGKIDSCTNHKLLENTVCFTGSSVYSDKSLISVANGWLPALVQCKYVDMRRYEAAVCQTNDSMIRFIGGLCTIINQYYGTSFTVDQWKNTSKDWDPIQKLSFCSVTQRYSIDRTVSFNELPKISVF